MGSNIIDPCAGNTRLLLVRAAECVSASMSLFEVHLGSTNTQCTFTFFQLIKN